jgi:prepilin-type N-terminal cleavage/methylation domain-containing protein
MRSNKNQEKQNGFSLIELLIAIVILSIMATVAVIYGPAVIKGSKNTLAKTRLAAVADAQRRFRDMGRGRYASVCELATTVTDDGTTILPSNITKFENGCDPVAIDGWYVYDDLGAEDPQDNEVLRKTFMVYLQGENKKEKFCMGPDGILRKPSDGRDGGGINPGSGGIIVKPGTKGAACTLQSPEVEF